MKKIFSLFLIVFLLVSLIGLSGCNGLWDFDDDDDISAQPTSFTVKGNVNLSNIGPNVRAAVTLNNNLKAVPYRLVKENGVLVEKMIGDKEFDVDSTTGAYECVFSSFKDYFLIKIISKDVATFKMIVALGTLEKQADVPAAVNVSPTSTAKALLITAGTDIVEPNTIADADVAATAQDVLTAIGNDGNTSNITPVVKVSAITITNTTPITLEYGNSVVLTTAVTPAYATDKTINWTSSDDALATVDANGKVTAGNTKEGKVTITATAKTKTDAFVPVTIEIDIKKGPIAVTKVDLSQATATIGKGKKLTLTAIVTPGDADIKTVTWSSANQAVASVNATTGEITGVEVGKTKIRATAHNGVFAECDVEVVLGTSVSFTSITGATTTGTRIELSGMSAADEATFDAKFPANQAAEGNAFGVSLTAGSTSYKFVVAPDYDSAGKTVLYINTTTLTTLDDFSSLAFNEVLPQGTVVKVFKGAVEAASVTVQ